MSRKCINPCECRLVRCPSYLRPGTGRDAIRSARPSEKGSRLRPAVVWFGEVVERIGEAIEHTRPADCFLAIGTSLAVFPAAGLVHEVRPGARKVIVAPELEQPVRGFEWLRETAGEAVPRLVERWLA